VNIAHLHQHHYRMIAPLPTASKINEIHLYEYVYTKNHLHISLGENREYILTLCQNLYYRAQLLSVKPQEYEYNYNILYYIHFTVHIYTLVH
jgi:hypothetical protein